MAVRRMLIAGRYRLLEPVGTGGMGRVWLARDEMLDRDVAVKEFVPPQWMSDEEKDRLRARTLREARSAARLNHPHVVRIYDVVHAEDQPWIVMEYVASRSLYQAIGADGPFPPGFAAKIGLDVLAAITAAHRAGVLHRDVKPHNVLIGHDGRVVLTDFGLATIVDDGAVTGPGMIVGSPQYVSPERARDGASTVESDLWSFGATLYAVVEGRSPFARESAMATLMALATDEPDPPLRAGPLAPVLHGLLRREPAERLTATEVERRLRAIVASRSSAATGTPVVVPAQRRPPDDQPAPSAGMSGSPRRHRRGWGVAGLVAAAVFAGGGVAAGLAIRAGDPARPEAIGGTPAASPSSGAGSGGGAGGFSPVNCESPARPGLPVTPLPDAVKMRDGWQLLAGWSYFADKSGFRIAVPDGWTYETIGTTICFRDPSNIRILSIDPARSPQGDPVQACRKEVSRLRAAGDLPGYAQLGIARVPGLTRAADWEYTFDGRTGERMHAMTRWRAANDGRAYAIGLMTRELDWPGNFEKWGLIQSTFHTGD